MGNYAASIPRTPRTLTDSEQRLILKVTGEHRDGFRDHMILSLAVGPGLREFEVAGLDVGDMLNAHGRVKRRIGLRVFKTSNPDPAMQEVFLPNSAWYKMTKFIAWKRSRGESLAPDAPLFVSRRGCRIATRTIRHLFRVWQQRAGFDKLHNFHSLRHTACMNLYRSSGENLELVQLFARHRSRETTRIRTSASTTPIHPFLRNPLSSAVEPELRGLSLPAVT